MDVICAQNPGHFGGKWASLAAFRDFREKVDFFSPCVGLKWRSGNPGFFERLKVLKGETSRREKRRRSPRPEARKRALRWSFCLISVDK